MAKIRFRGVHLDFHTSPLIPDVGADFDAEEFARTLKEAHVDSINIFSKCHHGYCYYPTKVGTPHPSLKRDLLGEMVEALHRYDIRCVVYTSVAWDELAASTHPEWRQVDQEGKFIGRGPLESKGWQYLCLNAQEYIDYVCAQVEEVLTLYDVDGIWYDIIVQHSSGCFCHNCQKSMRAKGLHIDSREDRLVHNLEVERKAMARLYGVVKRKKPDALVVFNSRMRLQSNPNKGIRPEQEYMTHFEIESLPTGGWGYLHFPVFARYCAPLGKEIVGQTGRFHISWGDFGGLKGRAALEYECFRSLALGAKCSVGDQLHPRGKLDSATYKLIGSVYAQVKEKEPWCHDAELQADIGVLVCEETEGPIPLFGIGKAVGQDSDEGATLLLTELKHQFHLIDRESDFSRYSLIVAPDRVLFDEELTQKVRGFLRRGGALLLTHESGLDPEKRDFALAELGLQYLGPSPFEREFVRIHESFDSLDPSYDYVLYERGSKVKLKGAGEVLGKAVHPYFNRTWETFCSHRQTPPAYLTDEPVIVQVGQVIYISHPLFAMYRKWGYPVYRLILQECLQRLLPNPLLRVSNFPIQGEATVLKREDQLVLHLLYYPMGSKGRIDMVEDCIPITGVEVALRTPFSPKEVRTVPELENLSFEYDGKYVYFVVPQVKGHQMVAIGL
uniref:Beta-galactosidase n=1 Tax=Candidatus Caldatribacterium saccharofermentans TaxID=1454753 RepID=A0A7V4WKE8_9BACT